jgi:hypothetical protein
MMVDPFFTVFTKQGKGYVLVEAMGGEVQGPGRLSPYSAPYEDVRLKPGSERRPTMRSI